MENKTQLEEPNGGGVKVDTPAPYPVIETAPVKKNRVSLFMLALLLNVAVSAATVAVYDHFFTQKIVAMDLRGFVQQQQELFTAGRLSQRQYEANMDRFEAKLDSLPKNTVVLMAESSIRGVEVVPVP